jgi:hypothetical protein
MQHAVSKQRERRRWRRISGRGCGAGYGLPRPPTARIWLPADVLCADWQQPIRQTSTGVSQLGRVHLHQLLRELAPPIMVILSGYQRRALRYQAHVSRHLRDTGVNDQESCAAASSEDYVAVRWECMFLKRWCQRLGWQRQVQRFCVLSAGRYRHQRISSSAEHPGVHCTQALVSCCSGVPGARAHIIRIPVPVFAIVIIQMRSQQHTGCAREQLTKDANKRRCST